MLNLDGCMHLCLFVDESGVIWDTKEKLLDH